MAKYYAVKVGARTGVFTSWEECQKAVDGFSGAKFKKFHKLNPFVCHRRKPTTFRWWDEPYESLAINPDSQYTFV